MTIHKVKIFILLFIYFIFSFGCLSPTITDEEVQNIVKTATGSKLIVLDVYHDRCKSCKLIEPVMEKLKSDYAENKSVAFLKYDLSSFVSRLNGRKVADASGLENIYKAQRYTGVVLIIDTKTKNILDTLIAEEKIEKYKKVIGEHLALMKG